MKRTSTLPRGNPSGFNGTRASKRTGKSARLFSGADLRLARHEAGLSVVDACALYHEKHGTRIATASLYSWEANYRRPDPIVSGRLLALYRAR